MGIFSVYSRKLREMKDVRDGNGNISRCQFVYEAGTGVIPVYFPLWFNLREVSFRNGMGTENSLKLVFAMIQDGKYTGITLFPLRVLETPFCISFFV